ncbi:MAG: PCMD domain-containing protein, partial [Muribaculaceae bacterium]|nr:PCMD domain-containing protein [Muribaculaceae bacterium]
MMMKKNIYLFIAVFFIATAVVSCIKNDIPYPYIQANFLTIEAETQEQGSLIDSVDRKVTLYFPETTDLYNVNISEYTLTPGAEIVGNAFESPINLSEPMSVTLRLYQDFDWLITANQSIERYFALSGQVGTSIIDVSARRVIAYVSESVDIKAVKVESIKLGAEGSEMTPDIQGEVYDFSDEVTIDVATHGRTEKWHIFVEITESTVTTVRADAWTSVAWVYGEAEEGKANGIEYRIAGDTEWTVVPDEWLTVNGGSFYARIIHLSPLTEYEARAFSDTEKGEVLSFTTGPVVQVPNTNLDEWWLNGKIWNPWLEGGEQFWDTGNKGATTLGTSNSVPTEDTSSGSGWAAKLETRFIGIGSIGKLAAGNLFVGYYVRTDGTNGVLSFGRPFEARPTRMRGYLKYNCAPISHATEGYTSIIGQPDTCIVWCSLIDSPEPFEIRTNPKNRQLFEPSLPIVIAYGKVEYGETIENYIPFEFELKYNSTDRKPKYIMITASASKYGDFFTGGAGSV